MITDNKTLCNKGDIWYNGEYHMCPVDYCEIGALQDYLSQRKSKDKNYFKAQNKLRELMTLAIKWEILK